MKEKIEKLIELAKELGIEREVQKVVDKKFPKDFDMTKYGFEVYCDKNFVPIGIVVDDKFVITKFDADKEMNSHGGMYFSAYTSINGYSCGLFPKDFDVVERFEQLNQALVSIGGEPLKDASYLAEQENIKGGVVSWIINPATGAEDFYTCSEKAQVRAVLWLK